MPEAKCVSIKIAEKLPAPAPETFAINHHPINDDQRSIINKSKLVKLASASSAEIGQIAVTIAEPGRAGVIKRPRAIIPKPKRTDDSTISTTTKTKKTIINNTICMCQNKPHEKTAKLFLYQRRCCRTPEKALLPSGAAHQVPCRVQALAPASDLQCPRTPARHSLRLASRFVRKSDSL